MSASRIGVTGHRSFDDLGATTALIDHCLGRCDTPIGVWSSLAEGADRLVVDRVFARDPHAALHVILPLEADDYRRDFPTDVSREEFDRLLQRAETVSVTGPDRSGSRESAYERAGAGVVDAVDVLIAVWDGEPARGQGGTAHIVDLAREQGLTVCVVPVTRAAAMPASPADRAATRTSEPDAGPAAAGRHRGDS